MANIIEVMPDKDGKIFITLYGTKYQIIVKKPKPTKEEPKAETETFEESSDKSIEDQLMDGVSESFGCSSSLSLSAIFCVLTLSTITITKKRKH